MSVFSLFTFVYLLSPSDFLEGHLFNIFLFDPLKGQFVINMLYKDLGTWVSVHVASVTRHIFAEVKNVSTKVVERNRTLF
jgi:hypothetical protein